MKSPIQSPTFLLVSLLIAVIDGLFVYANYRMAEATLHRDLSKEARAIHSAFNGATEDSEANLLLIASVFANDDRVQQLLLAGKRAVEEEGGGAGGEEAAKIRQRLYELIAPRWQKAMRHFGARQLHFHLGPGALSFLRVHSPRKFGDRLDEVRFTIVDTSAEREPRSGFETGRVYAGIRGVVPVSAVDERTGEGIPVGTLEAGLAFDNLVNNFEAATGTSVTILLSREQLEEVMWPDFLERHFANQTTPCGCLLEASSREIPETILLDAERDAEGNFVKDGVARIYPVDGGYYSAAFFPLRDYRGKINPQREDVGAIVLWEDVSDRILRFQQNQQFNIAYALLAFLVIEGLLYLGFRRVTRHLREEIALQTAELISAQRSAEASNRAKSTFLANMSHELRTPLNAILGFAQILERDTGFSEVSRRRVESIHRGGRYLLTLINDILDLSKIEAGRFELFPETWATRGFFEEIGEMFMLRAQRKGIRYRYEAFSPLPAVLHCDDRRLRQIVINLLSNAIKFTDQGEVVLRVDFQGGRLIIEVSDSGPGIPIDQQEAIFEPFQQAGDGERRLQGTGLGLSISRGLAEAMGGKIDLFSQLGEGALFRLEVPAEMVSEQDHQSLPERPWVTGYRRTRGDGPLRLLVVDDVADNREMLEDLLGQLGFQVQSVADGQACLDAIPEFRPDLVLLDLRMPGLDGFATLAQLRKFPMAKRLPVIAVTAASRDEDREQAMAVGFSSYLVKPLILEQLLDALEEQLPLSWQSEPQSAVVEGASSCSMDEESRKKLLNLIRKGDNLEIVKTLEELALSPGAPQQASHLLELARGFRMREMRRILEDEPAVK
jgi:signal transduction histidine kinase/DNA-binding response OmpR family regulator